MTFIVSGSDGGTFPSWTTATRPASPAVGQMGYNTTTGQFDAYTSNGWVSVATSGNAPVSGPAFSAYLPTANQSISASTWTKVALSAEEFDTNSNFDSTTNYRFTPTVAGYYQIQGTIQYDASVNCTNIQTSIYKNGSSFKASIISGASAIIGTLQQTVSSIIYFNGSTDYVELWGYSDASSNPRFTFGASKTYFSSALVRSA